MSSISLSNIISVVELDATGRPDESFAVEVVQPLQSGSEENLQNGKLFFFSLQRGQLKANICLRPLHSATLEIRHLPLDELELASLRGTIQRAEIQLNFLKRRGHGILSVLRPKFSGVLGEALDVTARWSGDVGIEDFRPISLVGSLYKIISKVHSKRLVSVINGLVSPSQFTFIPGRQLLDCALLANEVNGSPTEEFNISKRLRQGCNLSPLLFNLVGELLNLMLIKAADIEADKVKDWAMKASCGVGSFPMSYLGLPIGTRKNSEDSWIWRGILSNYTKNDQIGDCLRQNSKMNVGNGRSIAFWIDGMISEFGEYEDDVWVWNIQLRRNLYDWELDQWIALMSLIDNISLSRSVDDFMGWSGKGDGMFSVKSCRLSLHGRSEESFEWKKWVWDGLAPPRVQSFLWQICHQKLTVRVELKRRGIQISDVLCPLCLSQDESIAHLFLSCTITSDLWSKFLRLWNISSVLPHDPSSILCSWSNLRHNYLIWRFIPTVIFWSIWKARNLVVFENGKCDSTVLFFITRFRLAKWFLAKYPGVRIQTDLLVGDPTRADKLLSSTSTKKVIGWTPPPSDMFKLNVDGAVTGDGMQGGIGGVLRDSFSCSLANFSSAVGPGLPILTELKAIKNGLVFFFSDLVEEIGVLVTAKGVVLRWVPRSCNMEAYKLAK
ncbi:hypothetical protein F3Y22_tig00110202pilonHSYRG00067 [Hibiscus syriacus]|uniref:Reverse transcriptase zinc-binding domain-containing protein n=1 Tax=Hibiscus syriacus TaxID=106335 RepID=A0A6A3BG14_HIBSY|nr:hypothetical protein F3Y22_tig00110202pilonHSYRG00067 [Hibiscus syriacus]